jgi:hypothetical protein
MNKRDMTSIQISKDTHKKLKIESAYAGIDIQVLSENIFKNYFENKNKKFCECKK